MANTCPIMCPTHVPAHSQHVSHHMGKTCPVTKLNGAPPLGINEAFITGGVPPAIADPMPARRVYDRTFQATQRQNSIFYKRFPGDIHIVRRIV